MENRVNENLLGSVIYEPNNKDQQVLLVKDLKGKYDQEFKFDHRLNISADNKRYAMGDFLSDQNKKNLQAAIADKTNTSFTLSQNELGQMEKQGLLQDQSLHALKGQYQEYQELIKTENKGELTEEKVINRMNAENQYNTMKKSYLETNPDSLNKVDTMERNVKAKNKQQQQGLNM